MAHPHAALRQRLEGLNLYLVGMMGSGKSTTGRHLAELLGYRFLDADISIEQVAGPVGEALVMTAAGLAVAIPAVLGYNALVRGNKSIITRMNRFAHDLHALLMTGSRVKAKG